MFISSYRYQVLYVDISYLKSYMFRPSSEISEIRCSRCWPPLSLFILRQHWRTANFRYLWRWFFKIETRKILNIKYQCIIIGIEIWTLQQFIHLKPININNCKYNKYFWFQGKYLHKQILWWYSLILWAFLKLLYKYETWQS